MKSELLVLLVVYTDYIYLKPLTVDKNIPEINFTIIIDIYSLSCLNLSSTSKPFWYFSIMLIYLLGDKMMI